MTKSSWLYQPFLFIGILLMSCGVQLPKEKHHLVIERTTEAEEGILFAELEFKRSKDAYEVQVQSLRLMEGKLKKGMGGNGEIACILFGDDVVNDTVYLENPLNPHYEEYGTDGSIKTVDIELEEAQAFVRTSYKKGHSEMRIVDLNNKKILYRCTIQ